MEKIALRLTNDCIKAVNPKRSKGIYYEVVKGMMSHFSSFGNNDPTL